MNKTKPDWVLMPVRDNGPEMYDGLFHCCAVPLDPALLDILRQAATQAASLTGNGQPLDLRQIVYRDQWARWYHTMPEFGDLEDSARADELQNDWDNSCPARVTHDEAAQLLAGDWQGDRSECESLHVCPDARDTSIKWVAYPKHYDISEQTDDVDLSFLLSQPHEAPTA